MASCCRVDLILCQVIDSTSSWNSDIYRPLYLIKINWFVECPNLPHSLAPDCPTICPKSPPQTKGMGGADVEQTFDRSWGNLGQGAKLLEETLEQDELGRLIPLNPSFAINAHIMKFWYGANACPHGDEWGSLTCRCFNESIGSDSLIAVGLIRVLLQQF